MKISSSPVQQKPGGRPFSRLIRLLLVVLSLSFLLWWALRNVPLQDIWQTLIGLHLWQIVLLLGINAVVITLITARWWLIARAGPEEIPFLPLVWNRLAVFGLSYFTPGPQVGGEPLQVIYLQRNHNFTYEQATSTVLMDKLVEFLVNFLLLTVGIWAVVEAGLLVASESISFLGLVGLGVLLVWPAVHLALLYRNILPITRSVKAIPFLDQRSKVVKLVLGSEALAAEFCQQHTSALFASIGVSVLSVAGILAEYALMAMFLGIDLSPVEMFAALSFLQLAFLVPLPGGLGAMEASQVFALGVFGHPAAAAISLTLLQRARDFLNGGVGLIVAGRGIPRQRD